MRNSNKKLTQGEVLVITYAVLTLAVICAFLWFFYPVPDSATVDSLEWETTVSVEEYDAMRGIWVETEKRTAFGRKGEERRPEITSNTEGKRVSETSYYIISVTAGNGKKYGSYITKDIYDAIAAGDDIRITRTGGGGIRVKETNGNAVK